MSVTSRYAIFVGLVIVSRNTAAAQTPALSSGKADKEGWPLPRWWKKSRLRFGKKALKKCKFIGDTWPSSGDLCPVHADESDYFCLLGDAFCCDEGCEAAYRCDCINGTFLCAYNGEDNPCAPVLLCSLRKPVDGTVCDISHTTQCSYVTERSGCTSVTEICQCKRGFFTCLLNYLDTDICVPASATTANAPVLEYTCPSDPVDPVSVHGDACTLAVYQPCAYGRGHCPGPNDGNSFSFLAFPLEICVCQSGHYQCTASSNSLDEIGCDQSRPDAYTSFPSTTPLF